MKKPIKKMLHTLTVLLITITMLAPNAHAQEKLDMRPFAQLPVQHEGRIKPLHSFAQITLKSISGGSHIDQLNADEWLALTLFDPAAAVNLEIFAINDKTLKAQLGLDEHKKLFSLTELGDPLNNTIPQVIALSAQDPASYSTDQNALMHLHEQAATYTQILRTFSLALPLGLELPKGYETEKDQPLNFLRLEPSAQKLEVAVKKIIDTKGTDPAAYNEEELKQANTAFALMQLRQGGENNDFVRIIPASWNAAADKWLSPWETLLTGEGSPQTAALMKDWEGLALAYREHNAQNWNAALARITTANQKLAGPALNETRLKAEILYRDVMPYNWAVLLYVITALSAFILRNKKSLLLRIFVPLSLCALAMALHGGSILLRIYILGRPPVGTLYESVLFVSLICAGLSALISLIRKNTTTLIPGTGAAGALLLIAPVALPAGDSLEVLVAVLNTNFWLATHVVFITAGYGVSILTACMAHAALALKNPPPRFQQTLFRASLGALFLMAFGTVLGGIWADQSWGRFWGWDPKENGALLICLWLIWAHHGRLSRHLDQTRFNVVLAALNIIVALSWFGVNLLNVGLHSYGFTSGMATGLATFCALELALIGMLWVTKVRHEKL